VKAVLRDRKDHKVTRGPLEALRGPKERVYSGAALGIVKYLIATKSPCLMEVLLLYLHLGTNTKAKPQGVRKMINIGIF
jgi:hypothetical protein